jgi:hypothetical protein
MSGQETTGTSVQYELTTEKRGKYGTMGKALRLYTKEIRVMSCC